jgi:aminocarboxymuconate-semialdehyde decarboxylase
LRSCRFHFTPGSTRTLNQDAAGATGDRQAHEAAASASIVRTRAGMACHAKWSRGRVASALPFQRNASKPSGGALFTCRVDLMPIDVHAHYVPHRILATLEQRARDFGVSLVKTPPQCALHFDYGLKIRPFFAKLIEPVEQRLDGMAAQGVSCQLLSVWPDIFAYGLPSQIAARWHRLMNESLSELCHSHPGRFALFASVPLPDAAAAAREAEFAVQQLGAAGLVVAANVEGVNLGELDIDEFWQSAVSLDAPIFIHPVQAMPAPRTSKFALAQIAQYTFDTTLCVGSLIFSGVLDRFPQLRIILAHGGGTFPYLLGRFDCLHARMDRAAQHDVAKAAPSAYVRRFHYDTVLHSPMHLRWLAEAVSVERMLLGSDYSFPPADLDPVGTVRGAGFSDMEVAKILDHNACEVIPRLRTSVT